MLFFFDCPYILVQIDGSSAYMGRAMFTI